MGMTMTQKILAAHAKPSQCGGGGSSLKRSWTLSTATMSPPRWQSASWNSMGSHRFLIRIKSASFWTTILRAKDIKAAQLCKTARDFAHKHQITHFYDVGVVGGARLYPGKGPGDSRRPDHRRRFPTPALTGPGGVLHRRVGSTDMAAGMATGLNWFKSALCHSGQYSRQIQTFCLRQRCDSPFDRQDGVDGALYKSLEFTGEGIRELTMDDRFTIANMAIEAGAKNGIFPVDDRTLEYIKGRTDRQPVIYEADPDAGMSRWWIST